MDQSLREVPPGAGPDRISSPRTDAGVAVASTTGCTDAQVVELFRLTYVRLCKAVGRVLGGDRALAEQVVMEAVTILYRRRDLVDPATAAGYLWRIALNEARTAATRGAQEGRLLDVATRRGHLLSEEAAASETPAGVRSVEQAHVRALVDALPIDQRIAIVLRYYCDWADDAIAAATDCRPVTVRSRLRRARKTLERQLQGTGSWPP